MVKLTTPASAIRCRGLTKRFGATVALDAVDLDIAEGTIHALVGENGAGKSTFLGIIAGRVAPTEGTLEVFETPVRTYGPRAARRAGIAAVYQELTIVPARSVVDNVFLGQERARHLTADDRSMRARFEELRAGLGVRLPSNVPAGALSIADQQLVEILRAVVADPRVILLDEPTASLALHEREVLFGVMRDLRASGHTLVFVSHKLDEVLGIADNVTVFRNGRVPASGPTAGWTKRSLVEAMLGRTLEEHLPAPHQDESATEDLAVVENLVVPGLLGPIDLRIQRGEILGIGGLVGSGRTTLLRALAGAAAGATGRLSIAGRAVPWPSNPRQGRRAGFALIPEDRQGEGLFSRMRAADNVVVGNLSSIARRTVLAPKRVEGAAEAAVADLQFDRRQLRAAAAELSGGNQQKLLVARWRHARPLILLADEPTRGVDIGAKEEIMRALRGFAAQGRAVVLVSSELEEVAGLADRVVVLAEGRRVGELRRQHRNISVDAILQLAFRTVEAA